MFAFAEWEVEEIRDRTLKQARHNFNQGRLTGNVPYGFDCQYTFADGHKHFSARALFFGNQERGAEPEALQLTSVHGKVVSKLLLDNPSEQDAIRLMNSLRRNGCKLRPIAVRLNALGYHPKLGGTWQQGHVQSVLHSRHTQKVLQTSALTD